MIKLTEIAKDSVKLGNMNIQLGQVVSNPFAKAFKSESESVNEASLTVSIANVVRDLLPKEVFYAYKLEDTERVKAVTPRGVVFSVSFSEVTALPVYANAALLSKVFFAVFDAIPLPDKKKAVQASSLPQVPPSQGGCINCVPFVAICTALPLRLKVALDSIVSVATIARHAPATAT